LARWLTVSNRWGRKRRRHVQAEGRSPRGAPSTPTRKLASAETRAAAEEPIWNKRT